MEATVTLDRKITAELIYFRGELMRVSTPEAVKFRMGQHVLVNYLEKEFTIRVINCSETDLFLFLPFSVSSNLQDPRRRYPRIPVSFKGLLSDVSNNEGATKTVPVTVIDLSHRGLAFQVNTDEHGIELQGEYQLINFDLPLAAKVLIANIVQTRQGDRFGCEFIQITTENDQNLRSFILYRQILGDQETFDSPNGAAKLI